MLTYPFILKMKPVIRFLYVLIINLFSGQAIFIIPGNTLKMKDAKRWKNLPYQLPHKQQIRLKKGAKQTFSTLNPKLGVYCE